MLKRLALFIVLFIVLFITAVPIIHVRADETFNFKPHVIRQGDGKGGWIYEDAEIQFLTVPAEGNVNPVAFGGGSGSALGFGLAQMDNGEIILAGSWRGNGEEGGVTVVAISSDRGSTWSDLERVPGATGRPMNLTNLGGSTVSFVTDRRYFSHNNGRTWPDSVDHPPTSEGMKFNLEGNAWVDRDAQGKAKTIFEIGWHYKPGQSHPRDAASAVFRRSTDGGHTWKDEISPPQWKWHVTHNGKKYLRGVSEGAIVRAANGDLVAALRTDMQPRYFNQPAVDHYEGTGVSISKDDGRTWSPINVLNDAGRLHANLLRLPNDDLIMTLIVRIDTHEGQLASYRRGCEAIVSHDHGVTWELDRKYILDAWEFFDHTNPHIGPCGHQYSILMNDGYVLTTHNNYLTKAISLIRWKP